MKATYTKYALHFKRPAGTSRGVLVQKETWFLILEENGRYGIGECGLFRGLSMDDMPEYEERLQWVCDHIALGMDGLWVALSRFPSIQFGVEQAFFSLAADDPFKLLPSDFTEKGAPIPINGLIWMGEEKFMLDQIHQKLEEGFRCIKMKIGAIDFDREMGILAAIRKKHPKNEVELRVDANGAFSPSEALDKLRILSAYDIHSIEQPIKAGNWVEMEKLCAASPVPIALDEELIGIGGVTKKEEMLQTLKPRYIILKPSLVGGFRGSREWISLAEKHGIGWWVTSALESNIGLNALAQWTYTLERRMPQGLGTGGLFTNNFESPLAVKNGNLYYRKEVHWQHNLIADLCI